MASDNWSFAKPPSHPGEILKEDILPELGITVEQLAERLGVARGPLSDVVNGKRRVNTKLAVRLGRAFKNGARFWLAIQNQRDIWEAEHKERAKLDSIEPFTWENGDAA